MKQLRKILKEELNEKDYKYINEVIDDTKNGIIKASIRVLKSDVCDENPAKCLKLYNLIKNYLHNC